VYIFYFVDLVSCGTVVGTPVTDVSLN